MDEIKTESYRSKLYYVSFVFLSFITIVLAIVTLMLFNSQKNLMEIADQLSAELVKSTSEVNKLIEGDEVSTTPAPTPNPGSNLPVPPFNSVPEMKSFESTRYNIKFQYPASFGEAQVKYMPEYFNDEVISFTNHKLTITYPRWEGGFGGDLDTRTATSKDGKTVTMYVFPQGAGPGDESMRAVIATVPSGVSGRNATLMSQLFKVEELEQQINDLTALIETLEADLASK